MSSEQVHPLLRAALALSQRQGFVIRLSTRPMIYTNTAVSRVFHTMEKISHPRKLRSDRSKRASIRVSVASIRSNRAVADIAGEIDGRIVKTFHAVGVGGRAGHSCFMEMIKDNDFRVYCFWLLARLLDEGHGWRITQCDQCRGFFIKTRRDPSWRPSRFCSEPCRRS